jgi:hypothetical protein
MWVIVTPMRKRGIDLTTQERRQKRGGKGDVRVTCVQELRLGRACKLAEVAPGLPMSQPPLPPLYDVKFSGMATLGFVLSGFEDIDGCAYAPSWWCRLDTHSSEIR